MKFFYKILNRFRLLIYINTSTKIYVNNKSLVIPLIQGVGIKNINHKESWFTQLLSKFDDYYNNIVFLDIGANIGQTLLNVKTVNLNWEYIGFEPNSSCVHYLKQLIQTNDFTNTEIFPVAVSNSFNITNLYTERNVDPSATIIKDFRLDDHKKYYSEIVLSIDIDSILLSKYESSKNYIIKIDIEGAELLAIDGMQSFLSKSRSFIICEVLDTHSNKTLNEHKIRINKLEKILQEINYSVYQIIKNKTTISSIKLINNFEIKLWTSDSIDLNDFIFAPKEKKTILQDFYTINND